jgi:3-oxoacyl-[acyl-carrier protein] reductase
MDSLKGKTAVITGSSRGIGKAIAVALAGEGVNVVLAARTKATLEKAANEISSKYKAGVLPVVTDVAKLDDLKNLVEEARRKFGKIDIVINNAGVTSQYPFHQQPLEDIEKLTTINYLGYVRLIRLAIPDMVKNKSGAIINMVSGSVMCDPLPKNFQVYGSLKAALRTFSKGLFWEMRDYGIKITSLMPGVADTDLTHSLKDITQEAKKRLISPDVIVKAVMFVLTVPANTCPLELAVINQQTPWSKPVIEYKQNYRK